MTSRQNRKPLHHLTDASSSIVPSFVKTAPFPQLKSGQSSIAATACVAALRAVAPSASNLERWREIRACDVASAAVDYKTRSGGD